MALSLANRQPQDPNNGFAGLRESLEGQEDELWRVFDFWDKLFEEQKGLLDEGICGRFWVI